ncbi:sodium:proton exchanger, partial [Vibrio echinoideorum]
LMNGSIALISFVVAGYTGSAWVVLGALVAQLILVTLLAKRDASKNASSEDQSQVSDSKAQKA